MAAPSLSPPSAHTSLCNSYLWQWHQLSRLYIPEGLRLSLIHPWVQCLMCGLALRVYLSDECVSDKRVPKMLTGAPDLKQLLKTDHMLLSAVGEAYVSVSFLDSLFERRNRASSLNLIPSAIFSDA